jgi:GntR family transcriptional regulator
MRGFPGGEMSERIPQYLRIYETLRRRVQESEYPVGSFLPPEPELCKSLNVSRTTLRKAIEMLIREGSVYVRRGIGTQILDSKATQPLQYISSFSETLRERGFDVSYRGLKVKSLPAPAKLAADLKIAAGDPVIRIHRVVLANGKPIAIMVNYLLPEVVPGIEAKADKIKSLYSFLESEYNVAIEVATDSISARAASVEEAGELKIPEGAPLLIVHRITYSKGSPIERADLDIVAGRYEYSVRTTERPDRRSAR